MNIHEAIENHQKSLDELVGFYEQSKDENNKKFLDSEIKRLRFKIDEFKRTIEPAKQQIVYQSIESYSWEQSKDLIKIYLNRSDLKNKDIDKSACKVEVLDQSLTLVIMVENRKLKITNLAYPVEFLGEDHVKLTKNFLIVSFKKVTVQNWPSLQKSSANKNMNDFKPDENEDPSQSMMNLMKKMYNEGDDEMKKMINKAWCEKKNTNGLF